MSLVRPITRRDIKGPALYGPIRDDYRHKVIAEKRPRRILVGEYVAIVFDNRHTWSLHIEEILRAENLTTEAQIEHEIAIANELMPTDDSLAATLFIELAGNEDPYVVLKQLVGLDEHVLLHVGKHAIRGAFEPGRSTDDKISAVQYLRFPLDAAARNALMNTSTELVLEIDHPSYAHRVVLGEATRASLAADYA
jgi:Protein of unknown function (DUF3501)